MCVFFFSSFFSFNIFRLISTFVFYLACLKSQFFLVSVRSLSSLFFSFFLSVILLPLLFYHFFSLSSLTSLFLFLSRLFPFVSLPIPILPLPPSPQLRVLNFDHSHFKSSFLDVHGREGVRGWESNGRGSEHWWGERR